MRIALAVLMVLHGVAHLPGLVGSWRLAALEGIPPHTTVLAGRVDVGDAGMRALGAVWLLCTVLFWVAATGAVAHRAWWMPLALGTTLLSLALSVLELPYARIGVAVNLAILAVLTLGPRLDWLDAPA
jgi:hypothetical protein